jgi:amino acid transporter
MVAIKIISLVKVLPLVLLVLVGLFHLQTSAFTWTGFPTVDKLGEASLILFFAFTGGETAMNLGGEMKNPSRTGPLGLLIGCGSIVLFFCLIQIVSQSTLGADLVSQKAPLAAVANALMGSWSYSLMIACAVIAIFGSLNSIVLVYPRIMFAGANDGLMPSFLSKLHPQYATPQYAIATFTTLSFLMAITGSFKQLLILATLGILLLHLGVVLAAIRFRLKKGNENPAAFKMVGGLTIPIVALLGLIWFMAQSKMNEVIGIGLFLGILTVIYGGKVYFLKK